MSSLAGETVVALIAGPVAMLCGLGLLRSAKKNTNTLANWSREQYGLQPMNPATARAITFAVGALFTLVGGIILLGGILGLFL
ncbi:hypothetical protein [Streptomyces sp. NPDC088925]|uniref:hypothetical protein n=1 Tax=Streptomyces sp. NPDC088925 TaxID=3365914 RepID=UPI00382972FD